MLAFAVVIWLLIDDAKTPFSEGAYAAAPPLGLNPENSLGPTRTRELLEGADLARGEA